MKPGTAGGSVRLPGDAEATPRALERHAMPPAASPGSVRVFRTPDGGSHAEVVLGARHCARTPYGLAAACPGATSVEVVGAERLLPDDGLVAEIAGLPALRRAAFCSTSCLDPAPAPGAASDLLLRLRALGALEELQLHAFDCRGPIGAAVAQLPRLRRLRLGPADRAAVESLVGTQVDDLQLNGRHTDGDTMASLHAMKGLRRLRLMGGYASFTRGDEDELRAALPHVLFDVNVGGYASPPGAGCGGRDDGSVQGESA